MLQHLAAAQRALPPQSLARFRVARRIRFLTASFDVFDLDTPTPSFAWYNFVRVHSTIKTTPAVEQGLTDHEWSNRGVADRSSNIMTNFSKGRRLLLNAITLLAAGPAAMMLVFGMAAVLARPWPKPEETPFLLGAFFVVGVFIGIVLCAGYLIITAIEAIRGKKERDQQH